MQILVNQYQIFPGIGECEVIILNMEVTIITLTLIPDFKFSGESDSIKALRKEPL